jgi:hypothetical protein
MTDLVISKEWLEATRGLSLQAKGVLVDLITAASAAGAHTLKVTPAILQGFANTEQDRAGVREWFAELKKRGFVKEVDAEHYVIAPRLWRNDRIDWIEEALPDSKGG